MSLLDHIELAINKGLGPLPEDTASAEPALATVNLLDSGAGYSLNEWTPNIPSLKSNGVWADSSLSDGRVLISGQNTNVIEKMIFNLSGATCTLFAAAFSDLQNMIQDARAFWDSALQPEPVYLRWWANGASGPQFALIYSIDMDVEFLDSTLSVARITLNIERESFWRGLPPGANPKQWSIEEYFTGQSWNQGNASLYQGTNHLGYGVIDNCQEFLTNTSFQSRNFIDIPAAAIPGDAPPLLCVVVSNNANNGIKNFISVTNSRTSINNRAGTSLLLYNSIPMSSGTIASGTAAFTTDNARGIAHVPTSALKRTVVVTPAGATEVIVLTWTVANFPHFSHLVLRGKYALFLRAVQIGGTAGAVTARITMGNSGGTILDTGLQPIADDTSTPTEINYMGTFEIPPQTDQVVSIDGRGYTAEATLTAISLSVMRSAGAGTIRLVDMILMPLGNYVYINRPVAAGLLTMNVYDDTGYFLHGKPDPIMMGRQISAGVDFEVVTEGSGRLQLAPGQNNRLYFLTYQSSVGAQADIDVTVRANIIPRWSGIRT